MTTETKVRGHVTTEGTGKWLKLQQALAILLIIGGFVWIAIAAQGPKVDGKPPEGMSMASVALTGGVVWYAVARVLRWWHHG
jgi:hypothetical protein